MKLKGLLVVGTLLMLSHVSVQEASAFPNPAWGAYSARRGYTGGPGAIIQGNTPQDYGQGGDEQIGGDGQTKDQEVGMDKLLPGTAWADAPNKVPTSAVKYKMPPGIAKLISRVASPRNGELTTVSFAQADAIEAAIVGAAVQNDPETQMHAAKANQQAQASEAGNATADVAKNQASSAIDFCSSFLTNFTVDPGNKWNKLRDNIFVPMGILLLLPGALLTQMRAIIAAGSPVLGDVNPWEGIQRSIVAVFLIPGTYLVVNYSIDLSNSITYTINSEYFNLFGHDMYKDAICAQIRAFPARQTSENRNALDLPPPQMGPLLGGKSAFAQFEGNMLEGKIEDPCLGIYQAPKDRADEALSSGAVAARLGLNGSNAMLTTSWNILCAFQMAYLYYLWFVGPVVAGLWVWPMKQLRNALPSWVEGVITLAFWALFWNTTILLMACFKGVDETGTIIMSALNFLATSSVKFAFDFAGLVKAAGQEAASMAEKAMKGGAKGAAGGHGGGGSHGGSHAGSHGGSHGGNHGARAGAHGPQLHAENASEKGGDAVKGKELALASARSMDAEQPKFRTVADTSSESEFARGGLLQLASFSPSGEGGRRGDGYTPSEPPLTEKLDASIGKADPHAPKAGTEVDGRQISLPPSEKSNTENFAPSDNAARILNASYDPANGGMPTIDKAIDIANSDVRVDNGDLLNNNNLFNSGDVLNSNSLVNGDDVLNNSLVNGDDVLNNSLVNGDDVLNNSLVDGDDVLNNSLVDGDDVLNSSLVTGDDVLNNSLVNGGDILNNSNFDSLNMVNASWTDIDNKFDSAATRDLAVESAAMKDAAQIAAAHHTETPMAWYQNAIDNSATLNAQHLSELHANQQLHANLAEVHANEVHANEVHANQTVNNAEFARQAANGDIVMDFSSPNNGAALTQVAFDQTINGSDMVVNNGFDSVVNNGFDSVVNNGFDSIVNNGFDNTALSRDSIDNSIIFADVNNRAMSIDSFNVGGNTLQDNGVCVANDNSLTVATDNSQMTVASDTQYTAGSTSLQNNDLSAQYYSASFDTSVFSGGQDSISVNSPVNTSQIADQSPTALFKTASVADDAPAVFYGGNTQNACFDQSNVSSVSSVSADQYTNAQAIDNQFYNANHAGDVISSSTSTDQSYYPAYATSADTTYSSISAEQYNSNNSQAVDNQFFSVPNQSGDVISSVAGLDQTFYPASAAPADTCASISAIDASQTVSNNSSMELSAPISINNSQDNSITQPAPVASFDTQYNSTAATNVSMDGYSREPQQAVAQAASSSLAALAFASEPQYMSVAAAGSQGVQSAADAQSLAATSAEMAAPASASHAQYLATQTAAELTRSITQDAQYCSAQQVDASQSYNSQAVQQALDSYNTNVHHASEYGSYSTNVQQPSYDSYSTSVQQPGYDSYSTSVQQPGYDSYSTSVQQPGYDSYNTNVQQSGYDSYSTNVQQPGYDSYSTNVQQSGYDSCSTNVQQSSYDSTVQPMNNPWSDAVSRTTDAGFLPAPTSTDVAAASTLDTQYIAAAVPADSTTSYSQTIEQYHAAPASHGEVTSIPMVSEQQYVHASQSWSESVEQTANHNIFPHVSVSQATEGAIDTFGIAASAASISKVAANIETPAPMQSIEKIGAPRTEQASGLLRKMNEIVANIQDPQCKGAPERASDITNSREARKSLTDLVPVIDKQRNNAQSKGTASVGQAWFESNGVSRPASVSAQAAAEAPPVANPVSSAGLMPAMGRVSRLNSALRKAACSTPIDAPPLHQPIDSNIEI